MRMTHADFPSLMRSLSGLPTTHPLNANNHGFMALMHDNGQLRAAEIRPQADRHFTVNRVSQSRSAAGIATGLKC
jgi:hypothetical protein